MASMADVKDLLQVSTPQQPSSSREILMGEKKKVPKRLSQTSFKKPDGVNRELYNLLYNDKNSRDVPPLIPTGSILPLGGYKAGKAKLGVAKKVRHWQWEPFKNIARKDDLVLHHWRRVEEKESTDEYPFSKFNKVLNIVSYTDEQYDEHLNVHEEWTIESTNHLVHLATRFDLRWPVIHDRWDRERFGDKSVEDLKERYYSMHNIMAKVIAAKDDSVPVELHFAADHERSRKEQLNKLHNRTQEQIQEEEFLLSELRKIEARRKERARKAQDLQKLISMADNSHDKSSGASGGSGGLSGGDKRKKAKSKATTRSSTNQDGLGGLESAGIRWPDSRGPGVSLRSHKMKIPGNVGQKKMKAIEQLLQQLKIDQTLKVATEDIAESFNALRSDLVLLFELRAALSACQFEIESNKHQYQAISGVDLELPDNLKLKFPELDASSVGDEIETSDSPIKKILDEIIDTSGSAATPSVLNIFQRE